MDDGIGIGRIGFTRFYGSLDRHRPDRKTGVKILIGAFGSGLHNRNGEAQFPHPRGQRIGITQNQKGRQIVLPAQMIG